MVTRIQNRNTGYSENLFSHNPRIDNNTLNSIDGATALKLDESYQIDEEEKNNSLDNINNENLNETEQAFNNLPEGVSIESASYMENNSLDNNLSSVTSEEGVEEYTPKLFSEDQSYQSDESLEINDQEIKEKDELFDQDVNEEEDFEIPAFLRKQKF